MRRKLFFNGDSGSALILVIILLVVGSIGVFALFATNKSLFDFSGFFRIKTSLQKEAETGFSLAKGELVRIAQASPPTFCPTSPAVPPPTPAPDDPLVVQGLCYSPERPTPFGKHEGLSRDGTVERKVYYLPDPENSLDNNEYPKFWQILSVATNTQSGQSHTVEAFVQLWPENFSEIMFGLLNPTLPATPGDHSFNFAPGTFEGHVHFAKYPTYVDSGVTKRTAPYFIEQFSEDLNDTIPMRFLGPVTFADGPLPNGQPFFFDDGLPINFDRGYITNHDIDADPTRIFNAVTVDPRAVNLTPEASGDVCLRLVPKPGNPVGEVWQYNCNLGATTPYDVYVGEVAPAVGHASADFVKNIDGTSDDLVINPPTTATRLSKGILVCPPGCNIHIKGVLNGALTVVADNIIIEGDIQYFDQSPTSDDTLGALARENIIIPRHVPQELAVYWGRNIDTRYPEFSPYGTKKSGADYAYETSGVTNFQVKNDRDAGDNEYFNELWDNPDPRAVGQDNGISTLDLDGAFFAVGKVAPAVGGKFDIAGLNDRTTNPENGVVMWDTNAANTFTLQLGQLNSYYTVASDKVTSRAANPVYCFWDGFVGHLGDPNSPNPCPLTHNVSGCPGNPDGVGWDQCNNVWELNRQENAALWIHGSLVARDYSITRIWPYGFFRRIIHEDPRFHRRELQPPGFPDTGNPALQVLWMKNYRGRPNHPNIP